MGHVARPCFGRSLYASSHRSLCVRNHPNPIVQRKLLHLYIYIYTLVGCPCVATAYNNTHMNYPPKNQYFLLIVFALRIIFCLIWLTDVIIYSIQYVSVQHDQ
jgi:hypothetical protein